MRMPFRVFRLIAPRRSRAVALATAGASFLVSATGFAQQGYQYQGPQVSNPYASGGPPPSQSLYSQPGYGSPYQQQYTQAPRPTAPKTPKTTYASRPYDPVQPYSYPGSGSSSKPKTAPREPSYQYAPKTPSAHAASISSNGGSLAQEVAELKADQRRLNRRVDALEGKGGLGEPSFSSARDKTFRHKVQYGDSLQGLASEYGVSVAQIKNANHLSSNQLAEGQVLKIPGKKSGGDVYVSSKGSGTHTVQRGETLSVIATRYGLSSSTLQKANNIRNPDLLVVGQKLVLPGRSGKGDASPEPKRKTTIASSNKGEPEHYVTKSSKPKATTVYADPAPSTGGPGSGTIPAPKGNRGITSYRVEEGDSIESVARLFGTTAAEIQHKNRLPSAKLPPVGEEIVVPQPGSVSS